MAGTGVTGDFDKLARIIKGLEKLASPAFRRTASKRMGEAGLSFVLDYFERGSGPTGRRWPPPKHRPGGMPLVDTGVLRNSLRVRSSVKGFTIVTGVIYAAIHNFGGRIYFPSRGRSILMPRRQFLPTTLPTAWRREFSAILTQMRREALGK